MGWERGACTTGGDVQLTGREGTMLRMPLQETTQSPLCLVRDNVRTFVMLMVAVLLFVPVCVRVGVRDFVEVGLHN